MAKTAPVSTAHQRYTTNKWSQRTGDLVIPQPELQSGLGLEEQTVTVDTDQLQEITSTDAATLIQRTQEVLATLPKESRFVSGLPPILYDKSLEGMAFVITSEPQYRQQEAPFGMQEVAVLLLRFVDYEHNALSDAFKAQLSGRYILNTMKQLTKNQLVGSTVWTLARNPAWPMTPQGVYPLGLAVYDHEQRAYVDDSSMEERLQKISALRVQIDPSSADR